MTVSSPELLLAAVRRNARAVLWVAATLGFAGACEEPAPDETPEAAVRAFVDAMVRSRNDRSALREAYELLDRPARRALARRAEEASALAGRRHHPWDMLPQGRFRLRFIPLPPPAGYVLVEEEADRAVVRVVGEDGATATIPLVAEDALWRLHLALPPPQ